MDNLHWYILLITGLIPLIIGFVWYHPKVFGTAWMTASGVTPDSGKGANMALTFGLTYVFSVLLSSALMSIVIHQFGFMSMMMDVPGVTDSTTEIGKTFKSLMDTYGHNFRTFKHGALHGTIAGIFIGLPIIGVNALYEQKKGKYIFINAGFWTLSMALMGGVICACL